MSDTPENPKPELHDAHVQARDAAKPSFVDRIKGMPKATVEHFNTTSKGAERSLGGKMAVVAGSAVGLGVAYDGISRMVTSPTNENGEKGEYTFGRFAIGAVETAAGLAVLARSATGKWSGGLHV